MSIAQVTLDDWEKVSQDIYICSRVQLSLYSLMKPYILIIEDLGIFSHLRSRSNISIDNQVDKLFYLYIFLLDISIAFYLDTIWKHSHTSKRVVRSSFLDSESLLLPLELP